MGRSLARQAPAEQNSIDTLVNKDIYLLGVQIHNICVMKRKKAWFILFMKLLVFPVVLHAEVDVKITVSRTNAERAIIIARNSSFAPVTIFLNCKLDNASADVSLPLTIVVPPLQDIALCRLQQADKKIPWTFTYNYRAETGDCIAAHHDDTVVYRLPFNRIECIRVSQGYYGTFSHPETYALDFEMPIQTPVVAARGGIVIETKQDSNDGCDLIRCKDMANFIKILHADGSIGIYMHLRYKGIVVSPGQSVSAGTLIGYSGNTGFSSAPHLDFKVIVPSLERNKPIGVPTYFRVEGKKVVLQKNDCVRD
jgi:murein DD-endopeptidase MepM/ murein hydrolase activator NlpD